MTSIAQPTSASLPGPKADHVTRVVAAIGDADVPVSARELEAFVSDYFIRHEDTEFLARDPHDLAGLIRHHLRLGARRDVGTDLVAIVTPHRDTDGWWAEGSTVLQIVTDDRQFLVDTVSMELSRHGWSIRNLHHPQCDVVRDEDGRLVDIWPRGSQRAGRAESWISVEVYPPFGRAADELAPELEDAVRRGLADVRRAVEDWTLMRRRVLECVDILDNTTQPVSPHHVRGVISLLKWLAADHFALLGYRQYDVDGTTFTPVPGTGLGILRGDVDEPGTFHADARPGADDVLIITKDSRRSPVHRPSYLDYVGVRVFDAEGRQVGEHRFLGLLASSAYTESVFRIPLLADKAARIASMAGFDTDSHGGHAILQAIATYPRDELFQASAEALFPIIDKVASLQERRQVRLFVRAGAYQRFLNCTVYLPRDRYTTTTRVRIQDTLMAAVDGESLEYSTTVTESVLARLFIVIKRPDDAGPLDLDVPALEARLTEAMRTWDDRFLDLAATLPSEERGIEYDAAYKDAFTPDQGLADLHLANSVAGTDGLAYDLYAPTDPDDPADLRFKVVGRPTMSLTAVLPHLAALGVEVVDERPFTIGLRGEEVHVYDFGLRAPAGMDAAAFTDEVEARFIDAFDASWGGRTHPGKMNALVLVAGLTWRQVSWLRAVARYLQQAAIPFSQAYVASALTTYPAIARGLVAAFEARFDPARGREPRPDEFAERLAAVEALLEDVTGLDHDRIIRMYLAVLRAVIRTNAFTGDPEALALKLRPRELALLPEPRPEFEIFVYSPRVQGVHLRFGSVARGGLRWSDRKEDFRTEVLGLVKAQMVKNTVIVPVGAKGGFVPQSLPNPATDRQGWLDEGVACYQIFIRSLLSVTDNIVDGAVVPPDGVVRYDDDDPYLVVAADKGTATFSDIANAISVERGFWLGDAFASGGSAGYDHKAMGITARGAWESVKRHFAEMGVDCQREDFTCVGIGDMAGDVFGNGMLLSQHTRLVAAFNHQHIFLDPTPDAATSYAERERLFRLPRSSWADYDTALISAGGGVFERSAKSVPVSDEARAALGLTPGVTHLTPAELIQAILKAPVDLLWNGGIGTYVKASDESHADAGDKANDAVRINGVDVRARCAGEGGNLGWTQRGRIEYARAGGRINTDFIDNSAGVDTSDHEVNIKILLAPEVAAGRLPLPERDELLASMTDEVAELVLAHNVDQNHALANDASRAVEMAAAMEGWMRALEDSGHLDRTLEALPGSAEMRTRIAARRGLVGPELATLLAWTKIRLAELVLASGLPDDPYLADRLLTYFPKPLRTRYATEMASLRLRREIITTVTVNRFVNSQGITAYHRLAQETGADVDAIVRAQLAARSILAVARTELAVGRMKVDAATHTHVRTELQRMVERTTRWLLHHRRGGLDIQAETRAFTEPVATVREQLLELMTDRQRGQVRLLADEIAAGGVDLGTSTDVALGQFAHLTLPVVDLAAQTGRELGVVASVHFRIAAALGLDLVADKIDILPRHSRWETMARAALRDDLQGLHAGLTASALAASPESFDSEQVVADWLAERAVGSELETLRLVTEGDTDLARMSVALRLIRSLL